jgi:RHS repeat-associated protein
MKRNLHQNCSGPAAMLLSIAMLLLAQTSVGQTTGLQTTTAAHSISRPPRATGQSVTLLPDGRWLLVGGLVGGQVSDAVAIIDSSGSHPLLIKLEHPRTGHTTTVLPDGSVFVFGGVNTDGNLVPEAEIIDVSTDTVRSITIDGLIARTRHTATLLTDGRVLLTGGIDDHGVAIAPAQLWSPKNSSVDSWNPLLQTPRFDHSAELLGNGEGLISGGRGTENQSALTAEMYNPTTNIFEPAASQANAPAESSLIVEQIEPIVVDTLPRADAADVPVDAEIAFRFNRPLRIADLNASTVTLIGPTGVVSGKVVGAEGGMLAFFTPSIDLAPGTTYTAFVQGAVDESGHPVHFTGVRFTTHRYETPPGEQSAAASSGAVKDSVPVAAAKGDSISKSAVPAKAITNRAVISIKTDSTKNESRDDDAEDWSPREENRHGQWRVLGLSGDPALASTAVTTSDLVAPQGHSGVAGHILRTNGKPLAGVVVSIGQSNAVTDAGGRFLLVNTSVGTHQLLVDGTVVKNNGRHYTKHYIQVEVSAGRTTVLPDPIYLPRVDPATEVTISSPAAQEIVLTHPAVPGLEVHIPKGVVLREYDGKIVTKLSITPVPVNRTPYPTPTNFSVYFTLQPGGAFVDADATKSVKIIYPNYLSLAPGTRVNFWNYDPNAGGWGVYGQGLVTKDGKQVVPDAGVVFRQFMTFGFGIGTSDNPPSAGPPPGGCVIAGDPVDCATGLFLHSATDMTIQDSVPISVTRTYRQNDPVSRSFGIGTNLSYNMTLYTPGTAYPYPDVYLILSDGGRVHYSLYSTSPYTWKNLDSPTGFYGSTLVLATSPEQFTITLTDRTTFNFMPHSPNQLTSVVDRNGNTVLIVLSPSGYVSQVISPNGRYIQFTYDASNRITRAADNLSRSVGYTYDASGRLYQVTDQNLKVETYAYDTLNRLTTIKDNRLNTVVTNVYDANNRVSQQTLADNAVWKFAYATDANNKVTQTTVTDPRNFVRQDTFNTSGYLTKEVLAFGQPEQQTYVLQRNTSNLLASVTDQLGRVTSYNNYDAYGHPSSVTRLSGTANAATTYFGYDPNYHQLAAVTDPLSHTTYLGYDTYGNLNLVTNALYKSWTIANNGAGLAASMTDPLGHIVQFGYQGGDLSTVTDGLGRTSSIFTDEVGRVLSAGDPLGNRVQYVYDARDQLTSITDPLNGVTSLTYDANGNILTVTDPRNVGHHGYAYDARNRVHTYTDPLGHVETYNYDGMGNLISRLDRKNQNTQYSYDALNRLHIVTYADASTITITWDAGNRPHLIADSANGTLTRIYDGLDRLTEEVSPQGQVDYTYDTASRRKQLTVAGHTPITYQYDNANRLTQIAQGTIIVGLAYDAANRRSTVTYPNGIVKTYGFDAADELQSLNFNKGATHIGDLGYTYDSAGQQITMTGSMAKLAMSTTANFTATFDAANRLTAQNTTALTYDNNGSLITNGANTFTWNVRNQLTATSQGPESLQYDALGRRRTKNATTTYVYDGWNSVTYNSSLLLTGFGLDEIYTYVNSDGTTKSYLGDSLGSTLALTDSTGATTATFSYTPYGAPTETGTDTTPRGYTGLEWDSAPGLTYSRNRYYAPSLDRFISEDPIGLSGGINTYAYADGDPISGSDPLGLWSTQAHNALIDAGFNGLSADYIQALKEGSASVDMAIFQLIGDPAEHAMSRPGENPNAARGRACDFVNARLARFNQMKDSPEASARYMAYFELGEAMHTVMDSTSPAHAGFKPWSILHPGGHGDLPGSIEDLAHLTPQLMQETINKMNGLLNGQNCGCAL